MSEKRCPDCLSERDDVGQRVKPVGTTCFATRLPPSHPCRSRGRRRCQHREENAAEVTFF
ncbi:Protein of unknown function [Gryllus bimaculatus]|nr:Protein of unknown function [Gryllus bimaculatus]